MCRGPSSRSNVSNCWIFQHLTEYAFSREQTKYIQDVLCTLENFLLAHLFCIFSHKFLHTFTQTMFNLICTMLQPRLKDKTVVKQWFEIPHQSLVSSCFTLDWQEPGFNAFSGLILIPIRSPVSSYWYQLSRNYFQFQPIPSEIEQLPNNHL